MERLERIILHTVPQENSQQIKFEECANKNNSSCPFIESRRALSNKPAMKVCVTGAAGQIAYSLVGQIATGRMLGEDQPLILQLLDIPAAKQVLEGVVMELEDCAYPLLQKIIATSDPEEAFDGTDVAIFVGAFPRKQGMERKDLIEKNADIFHQQGKILARRASPNVKVLVVGNPANTNCLLLLESAKTIPKENFSCLTRLDHNRAKAQVSLKLSIPISSVHNVIIWGNHSSTQYPSLASSYVTDYPVPNITTNTITAINNDKWVKEQFIPVVQTRGAAIIKARQLSSALSAANAIVDHVRDWVLGTPYGEIVSMGVISDGNKYGVPNGLIFSFPVVCQNGKFTIVEGLQLDDFAKEKIAITTKELIEERDAAVEYVSKK